MNQLDSLPALLDRIDASSDELDQLAREMDAGGGIDAVTAYADIWRHIDESAAPSDIAGLSEILDFIRFNTRHLVEGWGNGADQAGDARVVHGVLPLLKGFIRTPMDAEALGGLVSYLQEKDWPVPMGEDQAFSVMERLLEQMQDEEPGDVNAGAATETPADDQPGTRPYHLGLPDDAHPQLVDAFFNEVPQLAEELSQLVQSFASGTGSRDDLLKAQRLAHTIKGSSNVTGVPAVATLMHSCEDLLELLCRDNKLPEPELAGLLVETADCLAAQLDYLGGEGPAPVNTEEIVNNLNAWQGSAPHPVTAQDPAATEEAGQAAVEAAAPTPQSTMRVSLSLIENLLRQAGEVSISTVQLQGLGEMLSNRTETLLKQQTLMWERLNTIQELVEMRSVSAPRGLAAVQAGQGGVDPVFDTLEMDEYNELHSASNFLAESITDTREYTKDLRDEVARLKSMLKQQDILSRELNESVMGTRMVPFRSVVSRLERAVRQTARSTGKSVRLEIKGDETLVDSAVLNRLTDPLMHMIRNAVDHGIESPGDRARKGKPEEGVVGIEVARHGDNVSLRVSDDGKGLDYDRIRKIGADRGLIAGDPADYSDADLARLVLLPGFSTREGATQISGRGIGMDVVNTAVIEQRGTIDISSERGKGIEVRIRVPMTLISVHTLLVRNSGVVLGIPSSSVQQLIFSDLGQWQHDGDNPVFEFEERSYRVHCLSHLVGIDTPMPEINGPKPLPLLLIQGEREHYAVILEEVLDNRYLVVKRFGRYVPRLAGVIGGAILGDGSVAGIVDLRELLRHETEALSGKLQNIGRFSLAARREALPVVLVVDDSVSARRSLAELVTDAGYRSATAIDGLEALSSIEEEKPAAILLDMEMPRMNGLELAAHLRTDPETANIPLIMITSRSTEKHRRQAETAGVDRYFTKPYQEDRLIEDLNRLIR